MSASKEAQLSIYPDSIKEFRALCLKHYDLTKSYRGTKLQMKRRLYKAGMNVMEPSVSETILFTTKYKLPDLQSACLARGLKSGNCRRVSKIYPNLKLDYHYYKDGVLLL